MVDTDGQSEDAERIAAPTAGPEDAIATTEAYEIDEGIVLYDAENPLAWIQSTDATRLDDAA
jgi:hypothetical protein